MKRRLVVVWLCCLTMGAMLAYGQAADNGFQPARIVAFERVPADAQHMENGDQYKASMRMGDTVYACRGSGSAAAFMDWHMGKEFPARIDGKTMQVKSPNGEVVQLTITGKKAAK